MSNNENDTLLDLASAAIHEASLLMEEFTNTTTEKVLDELVAQVTKHIDDNNLDDLYGYSLPALNKWLDECNLTLAQQSQEYFYTEFPEIM
jgi:hypothetical protein